MRQPFVKSLYLMAFGWIFLLSLSADATSLANGIGATVHYSLASTLSTKANGTQTDYNTTRALGLGCRLAQIESDSIGWSAGLSYEWPRGLPSGLGAAGEPSLSFILFEGNGTLGIPDSFYIIGGLNYAIPVTSGLANGLEMKSDVGVQVGGGWAATPNFHGELLYRTVNFDTKQNGASFDFDRLWGFLLRMTLYF